MFRWQSLTAILLLAMLFVAVVPIVRADDPPGAKLYATYCSSCHGAQGQGGFAPTLGDAKYLDSHSDDVITRITGEGVPGNGMPTWSKAKGGSLTDDQITEIVRYLRSLASAPSGSSAPAPTTAPTVAVVPYAQTMMTVTQSTTARGDVVVNASLQKNDGTPVSGAPIAFIRVTVYGSFDLGTVKTDNSGIAALVITNLPEAGREVDVSFKGDRSLGSSNGKIVLTPPPVIVSAPVSASANPNFTGIHASTGEGPLLPPEGSLVTPNPPLVPTAIFALIVGCVWATYGYVVSQVVGIWKSKPTQGRRNTLTIKTR